ncbi:ATP-dependent DNA helicase RecQ [Pseudomonas sp. LAIL14HWK12:I2]|uniref:RecQ family ATP-dependent DNA helicase n=1 Tax=Pseudomonas sp. LAIL14HWK12:I2 TaxID=1265482 RepID=UPI0010676794|nr:RecQ family ATP-dependent DNA helicase [Pseudomonas sp. LAIL14HWK12:I2]TFA85131.1 ATP-dependent DNA helicase RecQ [Pseudomonas sp. LAIL14HWK12:I2]
MSDRTPPNALVFDLEVVPSRDSKPAKITMVGAFRPDTCQELELKISKDLPQALSELDALGEGADCVLGHNIIAHDLPLLKSCAPNLSLHSLSVVDTLRLSPLAFPKNPYHRLIKDYKLIRESLNSPLGDCKSTLALFQDQQDSFTDLQMTNALELSCYQTLIAPNGSDLEPVFRTITGSNAFSREELRRSIPKLLVETDPAYERRYKVCQTHLDRLLDEELDCEDMRWPFAYALAWLRVSGGNSVLAPWVRFQFPEVGRIIGELRDTPCGNAECQYCSTEHDPIKELKRYFGHDDFRRDADGLSRQHDLALAGMRGENVLAVLATGGGKSICYQLPALNRYHRNGSLTIIISPLQSLMKDQVDGLVASNIQCAAALNGLLTLPERADVLEKIQMGDIGVLLVSPEQFRNNTFRRAIKHRQVGAWVFDEAHCLSKWGNDFRPDYLYASRFIREFHKEQPIAPIGCFTATAKPDVLADIRAHFKDTLGITFKEIIGSHERLNLHFEVVPCQKAEKRQRTQQLLEDNLATPEGGAVVFVSSRKGAEELSAFLVGQGWACKYFHAGLPPGEKSDIQNDFIKGSLRVIVATNAFGMGVDKKDVRLVIHADTPGSLENYLQEAGRAGRDQENARCVLLYDPQDIESQFGMSERSKLSLRDIQQILKKLRQETTKRKGMELVITAGEILLDANVETTFTADDRDAETKVVTAIAWLERSEFLRREENQTRIFPARTALTKDESLARLMEAKLSKRRFEEFKILLNHLFEAKGDERINTDELMMLTGQSTEEVAAALKQMEQMGILINDSQLTVFVRHGIVGSSNQRLDQSLELEGALLELLPELSPEAEGGEWQDINLSSLNTALRVRVGREDVHPMQVLRLLRSLAQDRDGESQQRSTFELRQVNRDHLKLRFTGRHSWKGIHKFGEKRRTIARLLLSYLISLLPPGARARDLMVETTFGKLVTILESDMFLKTSMQADQFRRAVEHVLLYMHQQEVLILNHGMTVMRRAMTIQVNSEKAEKKIGFYKDDYARLDEHYREKCVQVHVMREYAERGIQDMEPALRLVLAYFSDPKRDFIKEYFSDREEILKLATSEQSWKAIINPLSTVQKLVVADNDDVNRLVLAGPGSGKTRVIVHRIAYLLRVRRVPASSIIALAFNRHAANEIRKRLLALVGSDAYGVSVMTYHAMSMRLTGTRFERGELVDENRLTQVITDAVLLLEQGGQATGEDDLCEQLLRGYRYILVDEYQDIDELQYRLVSALAGRKAEEDGRLCILAVGDDDQNIYDWRKTSNQYIEQFRDDYQATVTYLVDNYRSSANIIEASNEVIGQNDGRLKSQHPISIDKGRRGLPVGGRWTAQDPERTGKVLRIQLPLCDRSEGNLQAQVIAGELARLISLEEEGVWDGCAILGRTHAYLKPVQAWCELNQVPYFLASENEDSIPLTRQRGFLRVIEQLRLTVQPQTAAETISTLRSTLDEPQWQEFFETAFLCLVQEMGECQLSAQSVIDWLYEYPRALRKQAKQGLYLGTVHSAKGLEFRHVGLLDGAWSNAPKTLSAERRLYYVGMTRAEETLTLGEFESGNPFSPHLSQNVMVRSCSGDADPRLARVYIQLSLSDIDIGFAGRHSPSHSIHHSISSLGTGHLLSFSHDGERYLLKDRQGRVVGRTVKRFNPKIEIDQCHVEGIIARYLHEGDPNLQKASKVEMWEVVIPRVSGMPK